LPTAGLARKNQDAYRTSRPIPCGWSMCDIRVYFLARKNHKMHIAHLARFRSVGRCPCGKQHFREIATPDWVRTLRTCKQTHACARFVNWLTKSGVAISRKCCFPHGSMCDIRVCISWPEISQDAYRTSRPIPFGWSMCDIRFCISWPENHNIHIAHLALFRSVGRCVIFGFVFLGQKNHKMHIAHLASAASENCAISHPPKLV